MKKFNMIIIVLIVIIILLCVGILFTSGALKNSENMKTIAISGTCTIEVPQSDTNVTQYADTMKLYNDTKNNVEIISYNSEEAFNGDDNAMGGALVFAGIRDSLTVGENLDNINGFSLYECDGYYSAKLVNNSTHDNIVIVCKDLDLLKKIVSSAKFTANSVDVNTTDSVNSNDNIKNSTNNDEKPDGVTDEEWQSHLDYMDYRESHPYSAEDGSRFSTQSERDSYQSQLSSQDSQSST